MQATLKGAMHQSEHPSHSGLGCKKGACALYLRDQDSLDYLENMKKKLFNTL